MVQLERNICLGHVYICLYFIGVELNAIFQQNTTIQTPCCIDAEPV
jgi:hypothetical protein